MTPLLDASAMLSLLTDEPAAGEVSELLGTHGGSCSAVNLAEVIDVLTRIARVPSAEVDVAIDDLLHAGLVIVPCSLAIGRAAGSLRARPYRRSAPLSMVDCIAVATAVSTTAQLVSSDAELCRVARRAGVEVVPIQNSTGRRPRS